VTAIRPLVAGNWKMHGLAASLAELKSLQDLLVMEPRPEAEIMICPPATLLAQARYFLAKSDIQLGAQDCHPDSQGAHTGDISAEMLADAGAKAVIVGHSERRTEHGETDAVVAQKAASGRACRQYLHRRDGARAAGRRNPGHRGTPARRLDSARGNRGEHHHRL
jgi:triosephosphate isomerase